LNFNFPSSSKEGDDEKETPSDLGQHKIRGLNSTLTMLPNRIRVRDRQPGREIKIA
jgi:hypothetical protein